MVMFLARFTWLSLPLSSIVRRAAGRSLVAGAYMAVVITSAMARWAWVLPSALTTVAFVISRSRLVNQGREYERHVAEHAGLIEAIGGRR